MRNHGGIWLGWVCVDREYPKVLWFHHLSFLLDGRPHIMEYLLVTNHPHAIDHKHQRSKLDFVDKVAHEDVTQRRWQAHVPRYDDALAYPLVHEVEGCNRKQHGHAQPIHHCHIGNIQHGRLLVVNQICTLEPQLLKLPHRSCSCLIGINAV